ncbi:MAG: tRNA dihydrouridine(20/20a) synthase DusA [Proteobacteria bacterium]|jgi:tRNA-dihydrouridine synthase A|nr:tRNA dihydrouridine(20/20a) synthase DusA [Pseudomonadota bacterium]
MKKIAIAPMLDWTDRHYRYFMRQITQESDLYTEMVVADAILHGNLDRLLSYSAVENPLIMQLGGSDPQKLALASKICEGYGYSAINLNVGCPSDRVKSGNFGACLMRDAELVASCIKAMQEVVTIPITIKHRIGLDYDYSYDTLLEFVKKIADVGCVEFIVHARSAILKGLSPKQNREVPPLKYDYVYRLKEEMPQLKIMINGGIKTIEEITHHLQYVDGVMLGREAYHNPYLFADFDNLFFNSKLQMPLTPVLQTLVKTRKQIAYAMVDYLHLMVEQGVPLHHITRHMIGLYHGCSNAKLWRHTLTQEVAKSNNINTYIDLLNRMEE